MTIAVAAARAAALSAAKESDNPFVAFDNQAATAVLGGTATLPDGAALNAVLGTTYDFWRPDVTATTAQFRVTLPVARSLSCVAVCGHNLHDLGASIAVQRSINAGVNWSDGGAGTLTPTDGRPAIFRMVTSGNDAADWRLNITGLTAADPLRIAVAFFGDDLVMPVRFHDRFAPVLSPTEVQLQSNVSVGGNLLGSVVVTEGSMLQASFRHLPPAFVRGAFLPFIPHFNRGRGFFFGWRPATWPADVHYCWRDGGVIAPANDGGLDFMTAGFKARVFED
jgi:hypothetical protein